jgi:hypothetical protein
MNRHALAVPALLVSLALAGCGGDEPDVASDPGPVTTEPAPTAAPTVGTYPAFEPEDYTYTLALACYCVGGGTPVDVTVRDGEVTEAVYTADGRGAEAGKPADEALWLTINDVIDAANDTGAASVEVDWPEGQDYPSSVYVDKNLSSVDEEIGYQVSDVQVS